MRQVNYTYIYIALAIAKVSKQKQWVICNSVVSIRNALRSTRSKVKIDGNGSGNGSRNGNGNVHRWNGEMSRGNWVSRRPENVECRRWGRPASFTFHKRGLGLVMGVSIDYIMVLRHKYLSKCCIFTTKLYIINIVNSINNIVSFFLCQQNRLINKTAPHLVRFNFPQSIINPHFDWRLTLSTLIWISPCQPHKYIYKYDPNPCLTSSPIKWWFLRLPDRL